MPSFLYPAHPMDSNTERSNRVPVPVVGLKKNYGAFAGSLASPDRLRSWMDPGCSHHHFVQIQLRNSRRRQDAHVVARHLHRTIANLPVFIDDEIAPLAEVHRGG